MPERERPYQEGLPPLSAESLAEKLAALDAALPPEQRGGPLLVNAFVRRRLEHWFGWERKPGSKLGQGYAPSATVLGRLAVYSYQMPLDEVWVLPKGAAITPGPHGDSDIRTMPLAVINGFSAYLRDYHPELYREASYA